MQPPGYNYGPPPPRPQGPLNQSGPPSSGPGSFPGYQAPPGYQNPPSPQGFIPSPAGYNPNPPSQPYSPGSTHYRHPHPQPQQQYGQPAQQYSQPPQQYSQQPQFQMPAYQPPPQPQTQPPPQQMPLPGVSSMGGFMSNLSPINIMTGGLLSGPQQYMQQRVGWLKATMTGGTMSALFNISNSYVGNKLFMLVAPFLTKWTYTRLHEQIAGGQKYRPPSVDVNAPDLFIPVMAAWTYALLNCVVLTLNGKFQAEMMSKMLQAACLAWAVHWFAAWLLLKGMNVPGVPWSELLAYTGYTFVPICFSVIGGCLAGKWGYYALWAYGSLAMAIFMVRTMKRVIFQEAKHYAADMKLTNYLLLALAAFQFPFAWWMGARPK